MGSFLAALVILLAVVQTVMAARTAWRAKMRLGAIGLGLLATAALALPVVVYWRLR